MVEKNIDTWADLDDYLRQGEPSKQERAANWKTAIGLQAVDGLQPSDYLIGTARQHIEGEIDLDKVQQMLKTYYQSKTMRTADDDSKEEADRAAANIARILSRQTLAFNTNGYIAVHRQIFDGVFKHAGKLRTYDITKKEWILRGGTVNYLNFEDLRRAIDYDIEQEKLFDYKGLSMGEIVEHIARFVSGLWQIHAFCEGNTRTTAVFAIQYLRAIGFNINNDLFARHSWYFRNALVRANYRNVQLGIDYDNSFLVNFFRNLLMGEHNELRNRYMLINQPEGWNEMQSNGAHEPTSHYTETEQVPNKYRTSTEQVPNKHLNDSDDKDTTLLNASKETKQLVMAIADQKLSVKEMMTGVGLKHRPTFLGNYLSPAIANGFVARLYPDRPQHPRQKYLLTPKGHALLTDMDGEKK